MSANHHLLRRDGVHYYRRRVPDDVAALIGKRVIKQSLRTADQRKADQIRQVLDLE